MTPSKKCGVVVGVVLSLIARASLADAPPATLSYCDLLPGVTCDASKPAPDVDVFVQPRHIRSFSTLTTDGGSIVRFPPFFAYSEAQQAAVDGAKKADQDTITRLTATNASLDNTLAGWSPGWKALLVATVVGFAAGIYVTERWF